jgi:hypothetical protein
VRGYVSLRCEHDLIVTSKGEPIAVSLPVGSISVAATQSLLRSVRALQAQSVLQETSHNNAIAKLSMSDVDAEIGATRRDRRQIPGQNRIEQSGLLMQSKAMKATGKRQRKSDAGLLDHATNNLLRALKEDMLKKEGHVNRGKLQKEGYSDRLISRLEQA